MPEKKLNVAKLYDQIIYQLNKDLLLSGYSLVADENLPIEENIILLKKWFNEESEINHSKLLNFLYHIDLDEDIIFSKKRIDLEQMVLYILQRVKNKVENRRKYDSI